MEVTLKQGKLGYETPKVEVSMIANDVCTESVPAEANPDWE